MDEINFYHLNSEEFAHGLTRVQHVRKLRSFKVVKRISLTMIDTVGPALQGRMREQ